MTPTMDTDITLYYSSSTSHDISNNMNFTVSPNITQPLILENPILGWVHFAVMCLNCAFGTLGNFLIIAAVLFKKSLRTTTNVFIVNLAISDLIRATGVAPFIAHAVLKGPVVCFQEQTRCQVLGNLGPLSIITAVLNMMLISLNRYVGVCHPHLLNKFFSARLTAVYSTGVWITALACLLPLNLGIAKFFFDDHMWAYVFEEIESFTYTIILFITITVVPNLIVVVCYVLVINQLRKRLRRAKLGKMRDDLESGAYDLDIVTSPSLEPSLQHDIGSSSEPQGANELASTVTKDDENEKKTVPKDGDTQIKPNLIVKPNNEHETLNVSPDMIQKNGEMHDPGDTESTNFTSTNATSKIRNNKNIKEKRDRRVIKMLVITYFAFVISMLPFAVIYIADRKQKASCIIHCIGLMSLVSGSSINVVIYGLTNKSFKRAYYEAFLKPYNTMRTFFHVKCSHPVAVSSDMK